MLSMHFDLVSLHLDLISLVIVEYTTVDYPEIHVDVYLHISCCFIIRC